MSTMTNQPAKGNTRKPYLTNKAVDGITLELLHPFELDEDGAEDLAKSGWQYAEFCFTKVRVLVRRKPSKPRWLATWGRYVIDWEVHEVATLATNDGVIIAGLGPKKALKLYSLAPSK